MKESGYKGPPEMIEFLGNLEILYADSLKTLQFLGFLQEDGRPRDSDVSPPSFDKVRQSFSPEELEAAREFETPTLLLIPEGLSFANIIDAINAHKIMPKQIDAYFDHAVFGKAESQDQAPTIKGYRAVIVEGATEMPIKPGDDIKLLWGDRVKTRKSAKQGGPLKGMDRMKSAMLLGHSLRGRAPVDKENVTTLDDDPALSDSCVPDSYWGIFFGDECQPYFDAGNPEDRYEDARFRDSVGGDVLIS